jgi:hypothetical protein
MPRNSRPEPAPFIDVVNAHLPDGQTARMRADTVRGKWKPAAKADRDAAVEAGSVTPRKRAAKKATAKKSTPTRASSSDTATAGATTETGSE